MKKWLLDVSAIFVAVFLADLAVTWCKRTGRLPSEAPSDPLGGD